MKKQFPPPLSVACIFNQIYKCKACNVADPPRNLPDLDLTLEEETPDPYPIREKKSESYVQNTKCDLFRSHIYFHDCKFRQNPDPTLQKQKPNQITTLQNKTDWIQIQQITRFHIFKTFFNLTP